MLRAQQAIEWWEQWRESQGERRNKEQRREKIYVKSTIGHRVVGVVGREQIRKKEQGVHKERKTCGEHSRPRSGSISKRRDKETERTRSRGGRKDMQRAQQVIEWWEQWTRKQGDRRNKEQRGKEIREEYINPQIGGSSKETEGSRRKGGRKDRIAGVVQRDPREKKKQ